MHHTLEEYKKAIKIKYEIEKEAEHFDFLYNPSRGKLRDLCWLIFENNPTKEDLNVFRNLFCLEFDHTKKNKFKEQKDKFRPIETFFKGETDPSNIDAINLAAIMVDFQPRPFKKFNEKWKNGETKVAENAERINAAAEIENEVIESKSFVKNENEESEKLPEKGNFFLDLKDIYSNSKKIAQNIQPKRVIKIAIGAVLMVSSACLNYVQKKD